MDEAETPELKKDYAIVIEAILKQRLLGVKNEVGVYIAPTFPKIIYTLSKSNVDPDSEYYYLTKLAAKCTANRMVPDYLSEKKMFEIKEGNVVAPMGCVDGSEVVTYRYQNEVYTESFARMWRRLQLMSNFKATQQECGGMNHYIDLTGVEIYDSKRGFVNCKRIIRNWSNKWMKIKTSSGRVLDCTEDHPLPTTTGRKYASELSVGDKIYSVTKPYSENKTSLNPELAWLYGVAICDGCFSQQFSLTFDYKTEKDLVDVSYKIIKKYFDMDVEIKEWHRGKKGDYFEVRAKEKYSKYGQSSYFMTAMFEGLQKLTRHIPKNIFNADYETRMNFIAGLMDADGYIRTQPGHSSTGSLGSTNKELAIQEMLLLQSVGYTCHLRENRYTSTDFNKIRWAIDFYPTIDLINRLKSEKKRNKFIKEHQLENHDCVEEVEITDIEKYEFEKFSYDVTTDSDFFDVSGIYSHNCRSQLSVWKDPETGKAKFFGRWNCGVVTINLPDVALTAIDELVASKELEYYKTKDSEYESWFSNKEQQDKIKERFWKILSERLELCHRSLKIRRERLRGTKSDVAPILWQHGAYARLKSGETIDRFMNGGYTTTSLGYVGLWETVKSITGHSHTDDEVKDFAISILKRLNDACDEWNEAENNAGYSIYGTPEESTTYKFAKTLQKHDVVIGGINDKNFVMNSYHTDIREKVDAFTKLTNESIFQEYTKGGAISYVETANLKNNIPAILSVLKHIYENTLYAELNCKLDCCMECKYEGEIPLEKNEHGKLIWKCPSCGCTDQSKMNIVRRVCGYLSNANVMNQGRLADIKNRVLHL